MSRKTEANCGKCGLCLNVCPVYRQMKEEHSSPRARMQLIKAYKQDSLSSSPFLKEIISKCLMCGSCAANCPSGINHYDAFMKMRAQMADDHGEPVPVKSLIYLLSRDYRTRIGSRLAKTGQALMPDFISQNYNIGNIPLENLPPLNAVPFRQACGSAVMPDKSVRGTVAYFTGCATNYLYDDTGFAAVGILKEMGYKVIIPEKQTCCSIPMLFHGAAKQAEKNIQTNIEILKTTDADTILVDCSTCGEALKKIYPEFYGPENPLSRAAKTIGKKVTDILTFIGDRLDMLDFKDSPPARVTYHAPCHSKNSTFGHAERLIEKLPFVSYEKTADTEECCGGGGTFFYEYPEVSEKMVGKKIENARAAEADHWLTDCPVCRMNLSGNLGPADKLNVIHPLTLIYSALTSHGN